VFPEEAHILPRGQADPPVVMQRGPDCPGIQTDDTMRKSQ
jgi:hypothetical protein